MRYSWAVLVVLLAGCATGNSYDGNIAVAAASGGQALAGTSCTVSNNAGRWQLVTPGVVNVGPAAGELRVLCSRPGYRSSEVVYRPGTGGGGYGGPTVAPNVGIGIGGGSRVGVGVGLGFGLPIGGSGAAGYPAQITVEMSPQ